MGKAVSRIGDLDVPHCSGMVRATGSSDVFTNSRPTVRQFDVNTVHKFPALIVCPPHVGPVKTGSKKVFVNGRGVGRIGDGLIDCTKIAQGSTNVFAG
ncbi:PAAR domain-containing protein [Phenylobacterium sp.]|uniref:PAAR domain-containing protein n=1 Tax=Phenylobacterium sp. TaxID=1871053 RepID=UPI000C937E88|nr:PAAR domain-containing protein [Phenylobacterium sp.]MAK80998.1 hypothetical protein [Phenylobacterium sp.]